MIYRALAESEVYRATEIFLESAGDMRKRNGLSALPDTVAGRLATYQHIQQSGIFDGVELDGKIVAVASAIVRDRQWFLSGFWALPGYQNAGIGRPLLKRVMEQGRERGASVMCTWSSIDFAAVASYLRTGMMPLTQMFNMMGVPRLSTLPALDSSWEWRPLELAQALDLDARVLALRREIDHEFWIRDGAQGYQIFKKGTLVGYFYLKKGNVGPAVWLDPDEGAPILTQALRLAVAQSPEVRLAVPGLNHSALRVALEVGLRIFGTAHIVSDGPLGQLGCYIPSGPLLF